MIYLTALKLFHILFVASWFGSVVSTAYFWTLLKQKDNESPRHLKNMIGRIENVASIGIVITAVLMLMDSPGYLQQGWIHVKILLWVLAMGLFHGSRAVIRKLDTVSDKIGGRYETIRSGLLLILIIAITVAVFKPF